MSEEEKQAIEHLKSLKDNFNPPNYVWFLKDVEALDVVLNLIEKQQKEIESLKKGNKSLMDSRKKWKDRYYKQRYIDYKQEKEIEELKEIIKSIRHELKGNVITKDGDNYAPAKNLTKQDVYKSYVKLISLLKANYPFKEDEDVIKELLDE